MEKREFTILSSDGIHTLCGVVYLPDGEAKGFYHAVHGMTEHIERYDRFLTDLCGEGYIAFGYDHLGHGKSVHTSEELGFIAKKRGWEYLVRDVRVFSDAVRAQFDPDGRLPYFLMGHSMGSFVVRLAAVREVYPDALIVMGTGGKNAAADMGLFLIALNKACLGERHISPLLDKIAFGSYNKRFEDEILQAPDPWLTTDVSVRRRYAADPFCTFKFTVSAMGDLIRLMKYSNASSWYKAIPGNLPILLVSGEDDPVGNYAKGVREVERKFKKAGKLVTTRLFRGARHEILNDFCYDEVKEEILRLIAQGGIQS